MMSICRVSDLLATVALAVMMSVVVLDVVCRYAFNMPISASIELVEATIVGTVFMALPSASARGAHVSIDYVDALLSEKAQRTLERMSDLLIAALLAGLAFLLGRHGLVLIERGDVSIALHYPTGYLALFMALAGIMTALVHLVRFVRPAAR